MQLFLLLLAHVAMVMSVAGCHSDRDKDHRLRENCTGAGFRDLPAGLDHEIQVLLFPNNMFSTLSWTSFQIYSGLYEIDLSANKVPEVTQSSAVVLPNLSVLRLGSNLLTFLSDGSFTACPALTELYLENNSISSLKDHTFSGLSKLEILDLSANHISVLPDLMLHPLTTIETLYLESNKIKEMPDDWFSQKEEVPYLYLSANPWACSCSLDYLRRYLDDHELNIYVRDGTIIQSDVDSVACASPQEHKNKPVISLEESDLCFSSKESFDPQTVHLSYISTTPPHTLAPPIPDPSLTTPPAVSLEHHTEVYRVVTRSWYQNFTHWVKWSHLSGSEFINRTPAGSHDLTFQSVGPSEVNRAGPSPTAAPSIQPGTPDASTEESTMLIRSLGSNDVIGSAGSAGAFCVWLLAGGLLLSAASAACVLVALVKLVLWYKRVYKPLSRSLARRVKGQGGVPLIMPSRKEEIRGEGGVKALYRSVLFISREEGEAVGGGDTNQQVITLPLAGGEGGGEGGGRREGCTGRLCTGW